MMKSRWAEMDTMDQSLKRVIRAERERRGLTQEAAAALADMPEIKTWGGLERERGRSKPLSLAHLSTVARVLGTTAEDLVRKATRQEE